MPAPIITPQSPIEAFLALLGSMQMVAPPMPFNAIRGVEWQAAACLNDHLLVRVFEPSPPSIDPYRTRYEALWGSDQPVSIAFLTPMLAWSDRITVSSFPTPSVHLSFLVRDLRVAKDQWSRAKRTQAVAQTITAAATQALSPLNQRALAAIRLLARIRLQELQDASPSPMGPVTLTPDGVLSFKIDRRITRHPLLRGRTKPTAPRPDIGTILKQGYGLSVGPEDPLVCAPFSEENVTPWSGSAHERLACTRFILEAFAGMGIDIERWL